MGNVMGEEGRVGAVLGNWDGVEGGEAFPEGGVGVWRLQGSAPCSRVPLLPWMGPGKSSTAPFLGWHQPSQPPRLLLPFSPVPPS